MARLPLRFLLTGPPLTVGKILNRRDIAKSVIPHRPAFISSSQSNDQPKAC
jgi:hypothetical protein